MYLLMNAVVPMMSIKATTAASMHTTTDRETSDDVSVKTVTVNVVLILLKLVASACVVIQC